MIVKIKDKNKLLAIIIKPDFIKKKGINFFYAKFTISASCIYKS